MTHFSVNNSSVISNPSQEDSNITLIPRIYVACLAAYNNGRLHGTWISLNQPLEDVLQHVKGMLNQSPEPGAEEFSIHDAEGFGSSGISEYESIEEAYEKAQFVLEHGELAVELLTYYAGGLKDARIALDWNYLGDYKSELDYAMYRFDEMYLNQIPESVHCYIDYDAFQRDVFIQDYFSLTVNDHCHVFSKY